MIAKNNSDTITIVESEFPFKPSCVSVGQLVIHNFLKRQLILLDKLTIWALNKPKKVNLLIILTNTNLAIAIRCF